MKMRLFETKSDKIYHGWYGVCFDRDITFYENHRQMRIDAIRVNGYEMAGYFYFCNEQDRLMFLLKWS